MKPVTQLDNETDWRVFWRWIVANHISGPEFLSTFLIIARNYKTIYNIYFGVLSCGNRWSFSVGVWPPMQCNIKRKVSTLFLSFQTFRFLLWYKWKNSNTEKSLRLCLRIMFLRICLFFRGKMIKGDRRRCACAAVHFERCWLNSRHLRK